MPALSSPHRADRFLQELRIEESVVRGEDVRLAPGLRALSICGCKLVRWQGAHAALAACSKLQHLELTSAAHGRSTSTNPFIKPLHARRTCLLCSAQASGHVCCVGSRTS